MTNQGPIKKKKKNLCLDFWNLTWIICMALWCIIQIHCQQKSMKEEMREKGNRWYKIRVNVVNEEREWSGWIFFLFPHTFTLWYKLLCKPHRLRSWSAEKKQEKDLKEKIWSKTNVCVRIIRITHNNRNKSYQNQFAVISYLPGPWGFWTLTLLQSLFTANLAVCFPVRKALREIETDKYVKGWSFLNVWL